MDLREFIKNPESPVSKPHEIVHSNSDEDIPMPREDAKDVVDRLRQNRAYYALTIGNVGHRNFAY